MRTIAKRRALITGGARGLGLAIARRLVEEDALIVLSDLDEDALREAESELAALGANVCSIVCDVTDLEALDSFRDQVHEQSGPIQILVNNAGVVFGGPFLDVPLERHLTTYRVNSIGPMAVTHTFLQDLIAAEEGHLVNVASASGFVGLPFGSTYASSKWAAIGFSESIRLEMAKSGHDHVGVTTVCPSYVDTGMFEGARAPLLTTFLTPETVAEKIVEAILESRAFVLEPWVVKLTPFLAHALPKSWSDRLSDLFGASTSMKTWTGHGEVVDNGKRTTG